jgi:hypothetical protein
MVGQARAVDSDMSSGCLGLLIERYRRPVYCFLRQLGNGHEDARDLAQGFSADFVEGDIVSYADRARGKFRTLLIASVERYLALQHSRIVHGESWNSVRFHGLSFLYSILCNVSQEIPGGDSRSGIM